MVGIVSTYGQADWEKDIRLAKSKGITGFALNIGVDDYTQKQLTSVRRRAGCRRL